MSFPSLLAQWFRVACKPFVLAVLCSAALGLVLGNVAANAVCYDACYECDCFAGAATGTHYKITKSEYTTVYKNQYWIGGSGYQAGSQLAGFQECPSSPICVGGSTIDKLACGSQVEGIALYANGGTRCESYPQ